MWVKLKVRVRNGVRVRVRCFVVSGGHKIRVRVRSTFGKVV